MKLQMYGCLVLLVTGMFSGCAEGLKVAEVSGTVTMNGEPMEFIHVEFWPETGPRSFGKTDASGKYTLKTDDHTQSGAALGKHKVALRDTWPSKDDYISDGGDWVDKSEGKKSRIDTKYYDAQNSPITVEVIAGRLNTLDLTVDPAAKKR
jgi:hypothetical protein